MSQDEDQSSEIASAKGVGSMVAGDDPRVIAALEEYCTALEKGRPPKREAFLAEHADIAAALAACLDGLEFVHAAGPQVGQADEGAATDGGKLFAKGLALGDYCIVREVGRGGMGIVYEAEQMSLRRRVALKVLPFAAMMDPRHLQRFHNEARAAACLDHPHIVKVHAVGCERGVHYFAMQFIEGQPLAELIAAQRHDSASGGRHPPDSASHQGAGAPRSPGAATQPIATASTQAAPRDAAHFRRIAEWGIQAAEALEHAHSLGIVHRDIKPGNLMIDGVGQLWVTDFGLARTGTDASLTMSGDVLGTLRYMSPEQALAKHRLVDHRTDLYALGATLYELLTLRPAVDGRDREEILRKIAFEEPTPPRSYDRTIPTDLESIVLKALAKEPADRYSTAQELADELQRYLQGRPLQRTRPVRWWERFWRWCRRNPALASVSILAIAALLAATVVSLLFALREAHNAKVLSQALAASEANRRLAERRLAENYLDQGLTLCEQGEIGVGLLWLVRSLEMAPAEAADLQWAIRMNLAGWSRQLHKLRAVLEHQGPVLAVAFSPDGRIILTGSQDGSVCTWEASTGKRLDKTFLHSGGVWTLALSPDGRTLVTIRGEALRHFSEVGGFTNPQNRSNRARGKVQFWDWTTGQPLRSLVPPEERVYSLIFSPDGQTLATGNPHRIARLWHAGTGQLLGEMLIHRRDDFDDLWALAFSPDGRTLATTGGGRIVRFWEAATGKPRGSVRLPVREGGICALAFSPDGRALLAAASDYRAQLCDAASGKALAPPLQHRGLVAAVAFDREGQSVLTGSYDKTARLWHRETGQPLGQPLPHPDFVEAIAFSPDGRSVLTAGWDGTARLWNVAAREGRGPRFHHTAKVGRLHLSLDGRFLLMAEENGSLLQLWEVGTARPISQALRHPEPLVAERLCGDGQAALTYSTARVIRRWELAKGKLVGQAALPEHASVAAFSVAAFSPDGRFLVTGGADLIARIWETATGKAISQTSPHGGLVRAVAFSLDGRLLVTGSHDRTARTWEVATGQSAGPTLRHSAPVHGAALSPDGRLVLTMTSDGILQRWDRVTGEAFGRPLPPRHEGGAESCFSPDGRTVLSVYGDGTARLRDVSTGRHLGAPLQHYGRTESVAFGPDGRSVLTRAVDEQAAWLWEIPAPADGAVERLVCWLQVLTGLELDGDGMVQALDAAAWHQRCRRLEELGGPP